jgi:hypothetical protein
MDGGDYWIPAFRGYDDWWWTSAMRLLTSHP